MPGPNTSKLPLPLDLPAVESTVVAPVVRADPADLCGLLLFESDFFVGDGKVRTLYWTNKTGKRLLVVCAEVRSTVAPLAPGRSATVMTREDGSLFVGLEWETMDPTIRSRAKQQALVPYMALEKDESLFLQHFALPSSSAKQRFSGAAWWQYDKK